MPHIDYSTDIFKHFVRSEGWLPACRQQARTIRNRSKKFPLRYFTFCAADAIDVFMLERAGILRRSEETGRLEGVFFCERNEEDFGKIADLIGSPSQGFQGEFERIVLFEDDEDTEGRELYGDVAEAYSDEVRRKLRYKDSHQRLRNEFPFDIINLDLFGIMFPPRKGVITPLLEAIMRILEWQTDSQFGNGRPCKQFTLFLTSHIDREKTEAEAIEQLIRRVAENIEMNEDFRDSFAERYEHREAERLSRDNFPEFFCLALAKFMIHLALFELGWEVTHGPVYLYNRDDVYEANRQYQIMHSVSVYNRISNFRRRLDSPGLATYARTATKIIEDDVAWIDDATVGRAVQRSLQRDLAEIIEFRNRSRVS